MNLFRWRPKKIDFVLREYCANEIMEGRLLSPDQPIDYEDLEEKTNISASLFRARRKVWFNVFDSARVSRGLDESWSNAIINISRIYYVFPFICTSPRSKGLYYIPTEEQAARDIEITFENRSKAIVTTALKAVKRLSKEKRPHQVINSMSNSVGTAGEYMGTSTRQKIIDAIRSESKKSWF